MRKQASMLEIVAARCWNLLNEGQPFTPIFFTAMTLIAFGWSFQSGADWGAFVLAWLCCVPLLIWAWVFAFPLYLRNYLWPLALAAVLWFGTWDGVWLLVASAIYFGFTVILWGSIYYHWRIRIPLSNGRTFWKQVLQNSDSTSGNAQEQLPKLFILHVIWLSAFAYFDGNANFGKDTDFIVWYICFVVLAWGYAWFMHRSLVDWKPILPERAADVDRAVDGSVDGAVDGSVDGAVDGTPKCERMLVIVIDGMRKSRWMDAKTPFLDQLMRDGAFFERMETIYPARTVVCFSSMFTGASPQEHGIRSNMVWHSGGVKVKSIFQRLREVGKRGVMVAVAHLVEAFGADVRPYTVVVPNDEVDAHTIAYTKEIVEQEDPHLCVMQLIGVDQTGHSLGVFHPEYVNKIEQADRQLAQFVAWYRERYASERVHLIVCADHGQAIGIGGHGHIDEGEREVPFILCGDRLGVDGPIRVREKQSIVQLAATIADGFGLDAQDELRGRSLYAVLREKAGERG